VKGLFFGFAVFALALATVTDASLAAQSTVPSTSRIDVSLEQEGSHSTVGDAIHALSWPVAAVIGLVLMRKPITAFLSAVASRATKVSAGGLELELAAASQPKRETGLFLEQIRNPSSGAVQDSSNAINQEIASRDPVDYMVVDLGNGREWLTSRLFILAEMMVRMRDVKVIVFVSNTSGTPQRFVGIAQARSVRWSLAQAYPWLELALSRALQQYIVGDPATIAKGSGFIRSHTGALDPVVATMVVSSFISALQQDKAPAQNDRSWEEIEKGLRWERARWINEARLLRVLSSDLRVDSVSNDGPPSAEELVRRVLRMKAADYVACLVGVRFTGLIDRRALIDHVARQVADEGA
jgi:hypothetical protein